MTVGDIDGDGGLEVVFGTSGGGVHALRGATGLDVPGFPFRTRGRIMAPVLLVPLVEGMRGLHLVVQSYDGHLYAIHGATGAPAVLQFWCCCLYLSYNDAFLAALCYLS